MQRAIPRSIKNRVLIRDKGQCTHLDKHGVRCARRKWVNIHHVQHFAEGWDHSLGNLATRLLRASQAAALLIEFGLETNANI